MTTYWVQFDFSVTTTGPTAPLGADLSFLGNDLAMGGALIISLPAAATEAGAQASLFLTHSYTVIGGIETQPTPIYLLLNTTISNYFVAGSQPDPTQLVGPSVETGPYGPQDNIPAFDYSSYVWAQITLPSSAPPSISIADAA
jgi:hypothetical protein